MIQNLFVLIFNFRYIERFQIFFFHAINYYLNSYIYLYILSIMYNILKKKVQNLSPKKKPISKLQLKNIHQAKKNKSFINFGNYQLIFSLQYFIIIYKINMTDQLTPELTQDLMELLNDKKVEVRHGTLNVILQYTNTDTSKRLFADTNIISLLLKNVFFKELTTICLSNLINFSGSEVFQDKIDNTIEPILNGLKTWKGIQQELALLYFVNVSKLQSVANIIIGKDEKQGYFVELLFGLLIQQNTTDKTWHVANIFSNLTSVELGRKYFTKSRWVLRLVKLLFTKKSEKRIALLKTLRNCLFEWQNEKFIEIILDQKQEFINQMAVFLLTILFTATKLIENKKYIEISLVEDYGVKISDLKFSVENKNPELELEEFQLTIDLLMILTNVDFIKLQPKYKKPEFKKIIGEMLQMKLKEELKDKIEVLNIFFC